MKTIFTKWVFDTEAWGLLVGRAREAIALAEHDGDEVVGLIDLAELLGVSTAIIDQWEKRIYYKGFEYPQMTNLIKLCQLMDFDPRNLFCIEEKK